MLSYNIGDGEEKRLRQVRAEILVALRDLMYADARLMEDMAEYSCNYCSKDAEDTIDGHTLGCHFATAVDALLEERAQDVEGIRVEARRLREVLVDLASDDYMMMDETEPCTHCESEEHTTECPLHNALLTVLKIKRESLI